MPAQAYTQADLASEFGTVRNIIHVDTLHDAIRLIFRIEFDSIGVAQRAICRGGEHIEFISRTHVHGFGADRSYYWATANVRNAKYHQGRPKLFGWGRLERLSNFYNEHIGPKNLEFAFVTLDSLRPETERRMVCSVLGWHGASEEDEDKDINCAGRLDSIVTALAQEKCICENVMCSARQIHMFVNTPKKKAAKGAKMKAKINTHIAVAYLEDASDSEEERAGRFGCMDGEGW
ncbi:hypothetical protein J4E91_004347 [Alternaria rosae]|nr:hypothetical protein J4E91_004347 [Alternaria rosae]